MAGSVITRLDISRALQELNIRRSSPVIVHASLSAFGYVQGGGQAVVQALLDTFDSLVMPAFTYKTMLIPETGPADNGITYGKGVDTNRMAVFFHPALPVDRLMGSISEALRQHPQAYRSIHPIQSFTGINAAAILNSQTVTNPLAPIGKLLEMAGWVLLLGVDQCVNTSIHYGEKLAGRKQFIRWALTPDGVVECPGFPGCSDGFNAITAHLAGVLRLAQAGQALIQAVPLIDLVEIAVHQIGIDPLAFLCDHSFCERCMAVRKVHLPGVDT